MEVHPVMTSEGLVCNYSHPRICSLYGLLKRGKDSHTHDKIKERSVKIKVNQMQNKTNDGEGKTDCIRIQQ